MQSDVALSVDAKNVGDQPALPVARPVFTVDPRTTALRETYRMLGNKFKLAESRLLERLARILVEEVNPPTVLNTWDDFARLDQYARVNIPGYENAKSLQNATAISQMEENIKGKLLLWPRPPIQAVQAAPQQSVTDSKVGREEMQVGLEQRLGSVNASLQAPLLQGDNGTGAVLAFNGLNSVQNTSGVSSVERAASPEKNTGARSATGLR